MKDKFIEKNTLTEYIAYVEIKTPSEEKGYIALEYGQGEYIWNITDNHTYANRWRSSYDLIVYLAEELSNVDAEITILEVTTTEIVEINKIKSKKAGV